MELAESGFLEAHGVKLIGTTAETIRKAEDRLEFKETMESIHEPVAPSLVVEDVQSGIDFTNTIGYPVVLRPAYTLGGSGGGIAHNEQEGEFTRVSVRCLWSAALRAGRKSNMK